MQDLKMHLNIYHSFWKYDLTHKRTTTFERSKNTKSSHVKHVTP